MTAQVDITNSIPRATEIAFCFDTTGSMQPCIENVRKHIEKTCEELFKDIKGLKIGFISHGDYCDGPNCYNIQKLTDDEANVYKFIRNTPNTGGGDAPECYELAMNLAKSLGWSNEADGKVLVMIGDQEPHPVDDPQNEDKLDWRKELNDLKEMGVNVYPLQCLYNPSQPGANRFWREIGSIMGTPLLKLQDFKDASLAVRGFAHASGGSRAFASYEKKLKSSGVELSGSIVAMNAALRDEAPKYDAMEEIPGSIPTDSKKVKTDAPKKPRGRPRKKTT